MNISQNKLKKYIKLYLNDVSDYSDEDSNLAESVLRPLETIILESGKTITEVLKETAETATPEGKKTIKDFLTYIKEI